MLLSVVTCPPVSVVGISVKYDKSLGWGWTVKGADLVCWPQVAVIVTIEAADTAFFEMENRLLVWPLGIRGLATILATAGSELVTTHAVPPTGAGPDR